MAVTGGPAVPVSGACFACGQPVDLADSFCEACGAEQAAIEVSDGDSGHVGGCAFCPSAEISADGYCQSCGRKPPTGRDHEEIGLAAIAGVTDRGLRHHRNEDAMALAMTESEAGPAAVAVVCDGVSTSARADEASLAAARAAARVLVMAVRTGRDLVAASAAAVRAASEAVATLAGPPGDAPAATFVSAVLTGGGAIVAWLGDSRAYWLATGPDARQLTTDDSVGQAMIAEGLVSPAEALTLPQAHVVTGWIGADLRDAEPHVTRFEPPGPGVLLLCSDGLWNYRPEAGQLAGLALPGALTDPLAAARALVSVALKAGGADNVTAVLAPYPLRQPGPPPDLRSRLP
jgi:serine/threonine protein phosphatase PrpC